MLRIGDSARLGRRDFLRVGSLALGGLSLPWLLPTTRAGTKLSELGKPVTDKAVVFLFMHGGPSQFETFDPKMTAPAEIRSATGEIKTAVPGVTFGSGFPELAARADRLCVVRSFVPGDGNHDIKTIVGKDSYMANIGSAYASAAGASLPGNGLPTNCVLFPRAVDPGAGPEQSGFGKFASHGPFPASTAPFQPDGNGALKKDMMLNLPADRLDDRRAMLRAFDAAKSTRDAGFDQMDAARQKAFGILLGNAAEAFDLAKEDPKTVARYDTEKLYDVTTINKKWNNWRHYTDNAKTLGKLMLLARRLVERGAGFVTVTTNFVWDMHADSNNATVTEGMGYMAPPFDHAVSAFLDDLKARGLEDKVLLVACGEMGRTPRINKTGGRDHWGNLGPLLLAGGGLPGGAVIGKSSANGGEPNSDPVKVTNLIGTIMSTLFDTGKLRVTRGVSRELLQMADYSPIPGLNG
ncbi:hypothetical protein GobsT_33110 [Gemmata obscuriglobus]|uniref:DUF1501 domain-containing protein n=1 Tax=Gemmata obscuriglobus TaxID=114 RepID=A0A2Z3GYJ7_9BACT|nr:DUF1501 domain-containing protein [Gemmata obscuriglobus]AWM38518.1 DUF1501 domain-containing protein [Gemmata obscuriglobus]QEG28529.1 hypothetical protein GobsT_33110 [Gemmata obscuriglobus]VTS06604.1 sulfatase : Uncharacterized protein OS=Pirellula staleyi (strain ATCC 27377 / DSM 6068 / ICPB 4128) GN=Psta_4532 PE=4 SV=1: DUF1501 [Gemmata obscuriglobus UQM 2246]